MGAMEGAGAGEVLRRVVTSDSPLAAQLCRPHPSFQAGNHTLCLEGRELMVEGKASRLQQRNRQFLGPSGEMAPPLPSAADGPPSPQAASPLFIWVVQAAPQMKVGLHQAGASPPSHPDHPQGCPPPQGTPSPRTGKEEWGQHGPARNPSPATAGPKSPQLSHRTGH